MFYSILVLILSCLLAVSYQRRAVFVEDRALKRCGWQSKRWDAKTLYFLLVALIVLYSGLRSQTNDTGAYIYGFIRGTKSGLNQLAQLRLHGEKAVGFQVYQILVKTVFGNNYARFLTVTALITCGSYLAFFKRYSEDFSLAVFLFIASTFYSYTFAALRQCLAMAIGIWAIPLFTKRKYIRGILIVLLAVTFHKFSLLYLAAIFLGGRVWSPKSVLIVLATFAVAAGFTVIFTDIAETTGYDVDYLANSPGTNVLRTLVWVIPSVLSFLFRRQINRYTDKQGKLVLNLALIGSMLMILASFGAANLIGRTAYYFYPFFVLAFTEILRPEITGRNTQIFRFLCICGFLAYFGVLTGMSDAGFFEDTMKHNQISDLFKKTLER